MLQFSQVSDVLALDKLIYAEQAKGNVVEEQFEATTHTIIQVRKAQRLGTQHRASVKLCLLFGTSVYLRAGHEAWGGEADFPVRERGQVSGRGFHQRGHCAAVPVAKAHQRQRRHRVAGAQQGGCGRY